MKNRSNTILELSFDLWHGNLDLLFPGFSMRFSGNVALFHDAYISIYIYINGLTPWCRRPAFRGPWLSDVM